MGLVRLQAGKGRTLDCLWFWQSWWKISFSWGNLFKKELERPERICIIAQTWGAPFVCFVFWIKPFIHLSTEQGLYQGLGTVLITKDGRNHLFGSRETGRGNHQSQPHCSWTCRLTHRSWTRRLTLWEIQNQPWALWNRKLNFGKA